MSSRSRSRSRTPSPQARGLAASVPASAAVRIGHDTNSNSEDSIRCRVFIGNLATDRCTKEQVGEVFMKFGEVLSCSLHSNFAFVQFATSTSADAAVLEMHQQHLFGKRIDCNLAGLRRKKPVPGQSAAPPALVNRASAALAASRRPGSPPRRPGSPSRRPGSPPPRRRSRSRSPPPSYRNDRNERALSPMSRYEQYRRDERERYDTIDNKRDLPPYDRSFERRNDFPPSRDRDFYNRPPTNKPQRPSIDCEIVCLDKNHSRYADEVESRLRSIGLVCNIGYPAPELNVVDVVERIQRSGTLYAVVLQSSNAQHRSVTLQILHGTRQEHRNMPLDDALSFVARNFDMYLKGMEPPLLVAPAAAGVPPPPPPGEPPVARSAAATGLPAGGYHPPVAASEASVKTLLVDGTAEKNLSTDELALLIEKLKKEKEARMEPAPAPPPPEVDPRRAELEKQLRDLQSDPATPPAAAPPAIAAAYQQPQPQVYQANQQYGATVQPQYGAGGYGGYGASGGMMTSSTSTQPTAGVGAYNPSPTGAYQQQAVVAVAPQDLAAPPAYNGQQQYQQYPPQQSPQQPMAYGQPVYHH